MRVEHMRHAAPVFLVRSFKVPDLNRDLGLARNLEDFIQRGIDRVCFTALMRDVDAAVLARDFREFDQFVCLRKTCRHVLQGS